MTEAQLSNAMDAYGSTVYRLALTRMQNIADAEDESRELWEAVSRLPEKARTAVHLYYAEGYSAEEISQLMHIPAATVRTRLHRARKQLKELLGGIDDETCVSRSDGTNFGPQRAE